MRIFEVKIKTHNYQGVLDYDEVYTCADFETGDYNFYVKSKNGTVWTLKKNDVEILSEYHILDDKEFQNIKKIEPSVITPKVTSLRDLLGQDVRTIDFK